MDLVTIFQAASITCFILSVVFCIIAIYMFITNDVLELLGIISGKTAQKQIENIRQQSLTQVKNSYQMNPVDFNNRRSDVTTGFVASNTDTDNHQTGKSQFQEYFQGNNRQEVGNVFPLNPIDKQMATTVLSSNEDIMDDGTVILDDEVLKVEGTMLLDEATTLLDEDGTVILKRFEVSNYTKKFEVIKDIVITHTKEVILEGGSYNGEN